METVTNCWIFINCICVTRHVLSEGNVRYLLPSPPPPFPPLPPPPPTVLAACRRTAIGQHQEPVLTRDGCSWIKIWKFSNEPRDNNIVLSRNVLSVLSIAHLATFLPVTSCAHPCLAWRVGGGWPQCELAALCRVYGLPPSLYTWSPSPTSVQQYTSLLGAQVIPPSMRSCTLVPGT